MIDWEELEHPENAAPQANSLAVPPLGPSSIAMTATAMPAVAAPSFSMDVYVHLLEDEIASLRSALSEIIRMHYRLDDGPKA